jgi:hypothetical protein
MDSIVPLRGIELLRRRPDLYFPVGEVTGAAISSYLADDARVLGATQVAVESVDDWHIVAADVDWLRLPEDRLIDMNQLFVGMHIHPTRINGIRSEIFVGAFAEAAYVATPAEIRAVIGDRPLPEAVKRAMRVPPFLRSIAFALATANHRWRGP